MSAGRPVLGMIGPGVQQLISEADCGYAVNAGDFDALVNVICNKVITNKEEFEQKGQNGREYFERHFMLDNCITHIEEILSER